MRIPVWGQEYCSNPLSENQYGDILVQEVIYGSGLTPGHEEVDLAMDIYYSGENNMDLLPAVILLHGGSFIKEQGEKGQLKDVGEYFASRGFVVFSINYRTWSILRDGIPSADDIIDVAVKALQDAQKAISFVIRENNGRIFPSIDVQQLIIGGVSAGAITVNNLLYLDAQDDIPDFFQRALDQNQFSFGHVADDYSIAYGINLSGGILDPGWMDADEPPLISIHGSADAIVPYEFGLVNGIIELYGSKIMDDRLHEVGVNSYLYTFDGGGHSDIYTDLAYREELLEAIDVGLSHIQEQICLRSSSVDAPVDTKIRLINTLVEEDLILVNDDVRPLSYQIIDVSGRSVQVGTLPPGQDRVSLAGAPSGYYIFHVTSGAGIYAQAFVRR